MENDTNSIRKLGEKMMGGINSPKSTPASGEQKGFEMPSFGGESKQDKGMFEMPSFGEEQSHSKQGCECGHDNPRETKSPDNMFGSFGGEPQEQEKPKSADDMFGGGFGGMGSNDDADKLKELGKRMMGQ